MKLAIGADHAGFEYKWQLVNWLRTAGGGKHQILDVGTGSEESTDYPDYAREVAKAVAQKRAIKGILLCGTGIGMAMAANKIHGIRAAVVWDPTVAGLSVEHNDANVYLRSARCISLPKTKQIIKAFLTTHFGGGRHARRVKKIMALEKCVTAKKISTFYPLPLCLLPFSIASFGRTILPLSISNPASPMSDWVATKKRTRSCSWLSR